MWICPLTKKKFNSAKTYEAHTRSKKFRDILKKQGLDEAPEPIVSAKSQPAAEQNASAAPAAEARAVGAGAAAAREPGYNTKPAVPSDRHHKEDHSMAEAEDGGADDGDDSEWETASEDEDEGPGETWDLHRCLFDNHVSESFEANLEYMFKNFGFYLPDSEYLEDPEGLVSYLGLKLTEGRVPLYTHGDDPSAKQFHSLHAVQRHMVDTNQCRMAFEHNEDEYEDFYNYEAMDEDAQQLQRQLVLAGDEGGSNGAAGSYEIVVRDSGTGSEKVLGSREFSRYYRQRHKPADGRRSIAVGTVVAQYRRLGIETASSSAEEVEKRVTKKTNHLLQKHAQSTFMRENVNRNLPRNVPY